MKLFVLFVAFITCAFLCFGQKKKKEEFFLFDKNGKNVTDAKKAAYFTRVQYVNDTCWKLDTYNYAGPMIFSEICKDKRAQVRHGKYVAYTLIGFVDSSGDYVNGQMSGEWHYRNDTGRIVITKTFENGVLVKTKDLLKEKEEKKEFSESTVFEKVETESEFKGGIKAWQLYLMKNLHYPEPAIQTNSTGKVVVAFIVGNDGKVGDIFLHKSVEYSLDDEAIRLIKGSPKWEPAYQNGRNVKSYKLQPISFALSR